MACRWRQYKWHYDPVISLLVLVLVRQRNWKRVFWLQSELKVKTTQSRSLIYYGKQDVEEIESIAFVMLVSCFGNNQPKLTMHAFV